MTINERIQALQQEFDVATQQINEWSARRLRAEGALMVLRAIEEETKQPEQEKAAGD